MTTAAAVLQAIVGGSQHVVGEKGKWARSIASGRVSVSATSVLTCCRVVNRMPICLATEQTRISAVKDAQLQHDNTELGLRSISYSRENRRQV